MPSTAAEQSPGVLKALALLGCGVATYLALYQYGVIATVWEPFFHRGSRVVLHSGVAGSLPVRDAALGAVGYLAEALCVSIGWRQRRWVGTAYGMIVVAFVVGSVGLVIMQGWQFHAWCTLCLVSALISWTIGGVAAREWQRQRRQSHNS